MMYQIFYSKFPEFEGWGSDMGQIYLKLRSPINDQKAVDGLKNALPYISRIGQIKARSLDGVFMKLQNAFEAHELDNRSMMIGDVIMDEKAKIFVVESIGFSEITDSFSQFAFMKKLYNGKCVMA